MSTTRTVEAPDDALDVMLLGWSFMRSNLLSSALGLRLFDALSKEPGTAGRGPCWSTTR
jgi:hypothetical protein